MAATRPGVIQVGSLPANEDDSTCIFCHCFAPGLNIDTMTPLSLRMFGVTGDLFMCCEKTDLRLSSLFSHYSIERVPL